MAKDKGLSQHPAHAYHKKQKRDTIKKAKLEKSRYKSTRSAPDDSNSVQEQIRILLDLKRENRLNAHDAQLLSTLQRENQDGGRRQVCSKPLIQSERQSDKQQRSVSDIASDIYQTDPRSNAYRRNSVSSISTTSSVAAIAMPDEEVLDEVDSRRQVESTAIDELARFGTSIQPVEYYSAPQIRDLHKEAIIFKPKAVHSTNMPYAIKKTTGVHRRDGPSQESSPLEATQYKRIDIAP